jgi:sugar phosphate permease
MTATEGAAQRHGWYHGWNIVAVCVLAQTVANGLPVNAFSLFLRDWSAQLHTPISTLQLGIAAFGLFCAFLSPKAGVFADKYPARWLMGGGLIGIALFYLGVSFVTASWQLVALYALLLPISVVCSTALPANAVVSRWFVRRLGFALGLTAFGLGMAGVILPPIVAAMTPEFGWRTVWRVSGIFVAVVVAPLVIWVVRDRPSERDGLYYLTADGLTADGETRPHPGHGPASGGGLTWRDVLKRRNFWLLVAVYLPMLALYGACLQNLAPVAASHGLSQQTAGTLLSAFSLTHLASTLVMGLLSDRFGNRLPLCGLALTVAIGGLIVSFGQSVAMLGLGVMLVGLAGGFWPLLAAAAAVEYGASEVGRAFGLLMMFLPVIALVPFLVARIQEATGSYAPGLAGLAVLTFIGGAACLLMRERRRGRISEAAKEAVIAGGTT